MRRKMVLSDLLLGGAEARAWAEAVNGEHFGADGGYSMLPMILLGTGIPVVDNPQATTERDKDIIADGVSRGYLTERQAAELGRLSAAWGRIKQGEDTADIWDIATDKDKDKPRESAKRRKERTEAIKHSTMPYDGSMETEALISGEVKACYRDKDGKSDPNDKESTKAVEYREGEDKIQSVLQLVTELDTYVGERLTAFDVEVYTAVYKMWLQETGAWTGGRTTVYAEDIIDLLGLPKGGETRKRVKLSLQRLMGLMLTMRTFKNGDQKNRIVWRTSHLLTGHMDGEDDDGETRQVSFTILEEPFIFWYAKKLRRLTWIPYSQWALPDGSHTDRRYEIHRIIMRQIKAAETDRRGKSWILEDTILDKLTGDRESNKKNLNRIRKDIETQLEALRVSGDIKEWKRYRQAKTDGGRSGYEITVKKKHRSK